MLITRTSMFTGKTTTLDIPVTQEQLDNWNKGMMIQNAMPNLTADEREFIKTGVTKEEWDETFGIEEEPYSLDDFLKDELGEDAKFFTSDGKNKE